MAAKQGLTAHLSQATDDARRSILSKAPQSIKAHSWLSNLNTTCTLKSAPPRTPPVLQMLAIQSGHLIKRNEQHVWQKRWCCVVPHMFLYYFDGEPELENAELTHHPALDKDREDDPRPERPARGGSYNPFQCRADDVQDYVVQEEKEPAPSTIHATPVGIIDLECYSTINRQDQGNVLELAGDPQTNPDLRSFYFEAADDSEAERWTKALLSDRHSALMDERAACREVIDGFSHQLQVCAEQLCELENQKQQAQSETYRVRSQQEDVRRAVLSMARDTVEQMTHDSTLVAGTYSKRVEDSGLETTQTTQILCDMLKDLIKQQSQQALHSRSQYQQLEQEMQRTRQRTEHLEKENQDLQEKVESHSSMDRLAVQEMETELNQMRQKVMDADQTLESQRHEFTLFQTSTKAKVQELLQHKRILKESVLALRKENDEMGSEVSGNNHQVQSLQRQNERLEDQLAMLQRYVEQMEGQQFQFMELLSVNQGGSVAHGGSVAGYNSVVGKEVPYRKYTPGGGVDDDHRSIMSGMSRPPTGSAPSPRDAPSPRFMPRPSSSINHLPPDQMIGLTSPMSSHSHSEHPPPECPEDEDDHTPTAGINKRAFSHDEQQQQQDYHHHNPNLNNNEQIENDFTSIERMANNLTINERMENDTRLEMAPPPPKPVMTNDEPKVYEERTSNRASVSSLSSRVRRNRQMQQSMNSNNSTTGQNDSMSRNLGMTPSDESNGTSQNNSTNKSVHSLEKDTRLEDAMKNEGADYEEKALSSSNRASRTMETKPPSSSSSYVGPSSRICMNRHKQPMNLTNKRSTGIASSKASNATDMSDHKMNDDDVNNNAFSRANGVAEGAGDDRQPRRNSNAYDANNGRQQQPQGRRDEQVHFAPRDVINSAPPVLNESLMSDDYEMEDDIKSHVSELTEDRTQRHLDNFMKSSHQREEEQRHQQQHRLQPQQEHQHQGRSKPSLNINTSAGTNPNNNSTRPPSYIIGVKDPSGTAEQGSPKRNGSSNRDLPPSFPYGGALLPPSSPRSKSANHRRNQSGSGSSSLPSRFHVTDGSINDGTSSVSSSGTGKMSVAQRARMEADLRVSTPVKIREPPQALVQQQQPQHDRQQQQHSPQNSDVVDNNLLSRRHQRSSSVGPTRMRSKSPSLLSRLSNSFTDAIDNSVLGVKVASEDTVADQVSEVGTPLATRQQLQREKQLAFLKSQGLVNNGNGAAGSMSPRGLDRTNSTGGDSAGSWGFGGGRGGGSGGSSLGTR